MARQNEMFGRLLTSAVRAAASLKGCNVDVVDDELGELIGRNRFLIQRYRNGLVPDESHEIEVFTRFGVERALLDHRWARRFLRAARYLGDEEALLKDLFDTIGTGLTISPRLLLEQISHLIR